MPERERQAVAPERELARHVAVLGEDGGEPRKGVVARVRGEEEDQGRERLEQIERHGRVTEGRGGDLADDGLRDGLVDGHDAVGVGDEGQTYEQDGQEDGHHRQGLRRVPWLGGLEGRHAVRDGLRPGERDGSGGEGSQHEQDADRFERVGCTRQRRWGVPPSPSTSTRYSPMPMRSSVEPTNR